MRRREHPSDDRPPAPQRELPGWDPTVEQLIAFVRLALSVGGLVAIWLDPTQPRRNWEVAYVALAVYVVYSAVMMHLVRSRPRAWIPFATQVVDLLWMVPVVYVTEAANSPFFPFFVTFTLTAGMRWGRWASWLVCVYSLVVYAILLFVETPTPLDLNNDLMRIGYLLMVGVLGGYLTEYRRQREREIGTLRAVAEAIARRRRASDALAAIVDVARREGIADEVVVVLREPDHGNLLMLRSAQDVTRLSEEDAAPFLGAVAGSPGAAEAAPIALEAGDDVLVRFADADRVLAYPIRAGDDLVGAMLFFFRGRRRAQASTFVPLFVRQVIPHVETLYVLERARHARVMEERRRIARDLHDSFIQSLAALGLRLDVLTTASRSLPGGDTMARDLAHLRDIVTAEQKRVRAYVAEMREPSGGGGELPALVAPMVEAFRARTGIVVDVAMSAAVSDLPGATSRELAFLIREALANVEKHARATSVTLTAVARAGDLLLTIRDDGIGIDASRHARTSPAATYGLASMRERAQLLGGTFEIASPPGGGTELRIAVPLRAAAGISAAPTG